MPLLFVENLTAIDCSVLDPDRGLIGASWSVNVELRGELDDQSMVFDFSKVKKTIKTIIDDQVDHRLLVPTQYSGTSISGTRQLDIRFNSRSDEVISHSSPSSAVCLLDTEHVNSDSVIEFLQNTIKPALPSNVLQLNITLASEQTSGHYYCYSHGLKKHEGNCQRIAHGHRSLIQIWKDQQRDSEAERWLAQQWEDIYLGSEEDVVSKNENLIAFFYQSEQGQFRLELPAARVHLMTVDTTVECIAQHILELIEEQCEDGEITVKAFEGMNKGAIASSG